MWTLRPENSPSDIMTTLSAMPIFYSTFHHFSSFYEDQKTSKHCSVRFFIRKVVVCCLGVFKIHAIPQLSSKSILLYASNPCRFLRVKLMGYILKCYRNHNLFLFCVTSSRGEQKSLNCTSDAHFGVSLHIFTNSFPSQTTKVCSVCFFD
jgi:hypothetical protein